MMIQFEKVRCKDAETQRSQRFLKLVVCEPEILSVMQNHFGFSLRFPHLCVSAPDFKMWRHS